LKVFYCGGCRLSLSVISRRRLDRLQSVFNAAVRLAYSGLKYDRISALLRCHLHVAACPGMRKFHLAVRVSQCRIKTAHAYLARDLYTVLNLRRLKRRRLRPASSHMLILHRSSLATAGHRAFSADAYRLSNGFPASVFY